MTRSGPAEADVDRIQTTPRILVFCRTPGVGVAKSRLSATLGTEVASRLYEAMLADVLIEARRAAARVAVCFTPSDSQARLEAWMRSTGVEDHSGNWQT